MSLAFRSRVVVVCLPLTPAHHQARRAWCQYQQHWTRQQLGMVLFTDESRFTLTNNDARERVWRRPAERSWTLLFANMTVMKECR